MERIRPFNSKLFSEKIIGAKSNSEAQVQEMHQGQKKPFVAKVIGTKASIFGS